MRWSETAPPTGLSHRYFIREPHVSKRPKRRVSAASNGAASIAIVHRSSAAPSPRSGKLAKTAAFLMAPGAAGRLPRSGSRRPSSILHAARESKRCSNSEPTFNPRYERLHLFHPRFEARLDVASGVCFEIIERGALHAELPGAFLEKVGGQGYSDAAGRTVDPAA
jgi:hypothetical protein